MVDKEAAKKFIETISYKNRSLTPGFSEIISVLILRASVRRHNRILL